jgi:TDG/mug DNA glycosylase family protein
MAAGDLSARRGAYYADSSNKFWDVLYKVGLTDRRLSLDEYPQLRPYGIGLTDIVKSRSGNDATLPPECFDSAGFQSQMRSMRPECVAFNGKKAAEVFMGIKTRDLNYGAQDTLADFPKVFVLPSTSGSACRYWDLQPWVEFADWLRSGRSIQ